jgi:hypothetical protein
MELPQLFTTHIRTWFDDFCDPQTMLPLPIGQASKYRKAPPVTPQRFALPHEIGPVFGGSQHEDRLPPLIKAMLRDGRPSMKDVMEVWALVADIALWHTFLAR